MPDTVRNYSIGTFSWGSPNLFFVRGLPYSSNRHVTPVSVRGRKGLTCSIRALSLSSIRHLTAVGIESSPIIFGCVAKTIQSMALATHGPRAYFYALVTQLPISDLRSIVICVEGLSGLCLVDSEAKKAGSTQADTNQRRLLRHCYIIHVLCITRISQCTVLAQVVLPAYIIALVKTLHY